MNHMDPTIYQESENSPDLQEFSNFETFEWQGTPETKNYVDLGSDEDYSTLYGPITVDSGENQENMDPTGDVEILSPKKSKIRRNFPVSHLKPEDVPMYCQETIDRILNMNQEIESESEVENSKILEKSRIEEIRDSGYPRNSLPSESRRMTRSMISAKSTPSLSPKPTPKPTTSSRSSRIPKRRYAISPTPSDRTTHDVFEILDTPIPDDVTPDVKSILEGVEQWRHSNCVPQQEFASKILGRTQGTYSDFLRNSKSWDEMKSGRAVFVRMWNWLKASEEEKMAMLKMESGGGDKKKKTPKRGRRTTDYSPTSPDAKRAARFEFTDLQKEQLYEIFANCRYPSQKEKEKISKIMDIPLKTVAEFFANARRRMSD